MSPEEQRLADLLKRAVPEPPRELTHEEIMVPHANRSRRSWLMPTLAAAAVVIIGVTAGAVATHHSGPGTGSLLPVAGSTPAGATPSASPTPTDCASGPQRAAVTVPNAIGMSAAPAIATLQATGLDVVVVSESASTAPPGTVTRQSPAAGTQVAMGSAVTLYVSGATTSAGAASSPAAPTTASTCPATPVPTASGGASSPVATGSGGGSAPVPTASGGATTTPPSAVVLPNVIGQTAAQATSTLKAAGFRVVVQAQAAPAAQPVPAGVVWQQSPAAGTAAAPRTTITVFIQPAS